MTKIKITKSQREKIKKNGGEFEIKFENGEVNTQIKNYNPNRKTRAFI